MVEKLVVSLELNLAWLTVEQSGSFLVEKLVDCLVV
jgi:hypothetical protein